MNNVQKVVYSNVTVFWTKTHKHEMSHTSVDFRAVFYEVFLTFRDLLLIVYVATLPSFFVANIYQPENSSSCRRLRMCSKWLIYLEFRLENRDKPAESFSIWPSPIHLELSSINHQLLLRFKLYNEASIVYKFSMLGTGKGHWKGMFKAPALTVIGNSLPASAMKRTDGRTHTCELLHVIIHVRLLN
jgi:hypothetical protein